MAAKSHVWEVTELEQREIPPTGGLVLSSTLNIAVRVPTGISATVMVTNLTIIHTFIGDVQVSLTSPSGTEVELFTNVGGSDGGLAAATFRDDAGTEFGSINDPNDDVHLGGSYNPEGAETLASFGSTGLSGAWTLRIRDSVSDADRGDLLSWGLLIGYQYNGVLTGSSAPNTLNGGDVVDRISGLAGNDTIRAYNANDTLIGGPGRDLMYGGSGADDFDFNAVSESRVGSLRDRILDFSHADDIDLRTIDAETGSGNQAFRFIGTQAFSNSKGELRYTDQGAQCLVQGDVNGDGRADFEIMVKIASMVKGDFLL